ncbi:conserved hypothetical protein [Ricinus communis]|uniref:Uncharacterized protein n=1 Tax=Ricinus communis TaxID=3988 RepID=B9SP36_RICCO|nr:conserved hypothetical protein [Ricinus communis]
MGCSLDSTWCFQMGMITRGYSPKHKKEHWYARQFQYLSASYNRYYLLNKRHVHEKLLIFWKGSIESPLPIYDCWLSLF